MKFLKHGILYVALTIFSLATANVVFAAPPKAAAKVIVAKSGGDYTTITDALNAITPSASSPYVIEVWPGTYTENVTMKSYVSLVGSGRDVTTIQALNPSVVDIALNSLTNVSISGFTITGGYSGIDNESSEADVRNNLFTGNTYYAILYDSGSASGVISNNIIENDGTNSSVGQIEALAGASPLIKGNTISNNYGRGIATVGSNSVIEGNVITGCTSWGILLQPGGSVKLIHNIITNNTLEDINVLNGVVPLISFNVYDTITGSTGVGNYNVTSNGDPAPAP